MNNQPRIALALAAAMAAFAFPGHAQSWIKPGEETLLLRLGAVSSNFNTSARIDGKTAGGSDINYEDQLGLDSNKSTYSLAGALRFARNHRLDGAYDDNKRSASKTTERSYTIGDTTIPAGTVLGAEQRTSIGYLGYRYSLLKSDAMEVGLGLGVYGGNFKFKFGADSPVINIDKSTTLPLPVLVASGDFYLTERATITATLRGLKVKIGDVDGSVYEAVLAGEYLLTNNVGIGASVGRFDMQADVTKSGFSGSTELKSTAARLYLTARF